MFLSSCKCHYNGESINQVLVKENPYWTIPSLIISHIVRLDSTMLNIVFINGDLNRVKLKRVICILELHTHNTSSYLINPLSSIPPFLHTQPPGPLNLIVAFRYLKYLALSPPPSLLAHIPLDP